MTYLESCKNVDTKCIIKMFIDIIFNSFSNNALTVTTALFSFFL